MSRPVNGESFWMVAIECDLWKSVMREAVT